MEGCSGHAVELAVLTSFDHAADCAVAVYLASTANEEQRLSEEPGQACNAVTFAPAAAGVVPPARRIGKAWTRTRQGSSGGSSVAAADSDGSDDASEGSSESEDDSGGAASGLPMAAKSGAAAAAAGGAVPAGRAPRHRRPVTPQAGAALS
ncbi:hypothetical protein MNEG_13821 [Monoraphidium neglectum]|jgi:hypothetical protein|uniref:Uncharacterized protein n=1 Tax=Monoraphidium neglectum TaxID=145388 RepID=A0A0D2LXC4_9CHLO|nr:hypothetical protein MNEG_13821 [Monoraphidium neglectum]KIY94141.1 hypothetical protein MNEG_13821 [Monoraphidium neglectum]|eukprot:XP_013893161.1 hypothetical protein MNEG_13821 [Monoraphidium neglectum]